MTIWRVLTVGAENALSSREICRILKITPRQLRLAVERERRQGIPICANCGTNPGYFIAADRQEMERYCGRLLHRAGEIHKTRRACLQTLAKLPD